MGLCVSSLRSSVTCRMSTTFLFTSLVILSPWVWKMLLIDCLIFSTLHGDSPRATKLSSRYRPILFPNFLDSSADKKAPTNSQVSDSSYDPMVTSNGLSGDLLYQGWCMLKSRGFFECRICRYEICQ